MTKSVICDLGFLFSSSSSFREITDCSKKEPGYGTHWYMQYIVLIHKIDQNNTDQLSVVRPNPQYKCTILFGWFLTRAFRAEGRTLKILVHRGFAVQRCPCVQFCSRTETYSSSRRCKKSRTTTTLQTSSWGSSRGGTAAIHGECFLSFLIVVVVVLAEQWCSARIFHLYTEQSSSRIRTRSKISSSQRAVFLRSNNDPNGSRYPPMINQDHGDPMRLAASMRSSCCHRDLKSQSSIQGQYSSYCIKRPGGL